MVAGALMMLREEFPNESPNSLTLRLLSTAVPMADPQKSGAGRMDVYAALTYTFPPPSPTVFIEGPRAVPLWQYCSFHAVASSGTEPYAFTWYVNGSVEQEGSDWFDWGAGDDYTLTVRVTDANELHGEFTLYLHPSSLIQGCENP